MISAYSRGGAAFFLCAFAATAAQADITAQDVWSDWQAYLAGTGYEVTGTESVSGDTLTVSDTALSMVIPDSDVTLAMQLGDITFTESADGTVNVGFPATMPITISGNDEAGDAFEAVIDYTQSGFSMIVSGDPADMTYNYTASSLAMTLGSISVNGTAMPPDAAKVNFDIANVIGTTRMQGADLRTYTQTAKSGAVTYEVFFKDPEGSGELNWSGQSEGLEMESVSSLPMEMDPENMAAMIDAGFAAEGGFGFGPGSSALSFVEDGESFNYESSSAGGSADVLIGTEGVGYEISQQDLAVNLAGSEIPLPVSLNFSKAVFGLLIPLMEGEDPQPFELTVNLDEFTMSDLIWGIFDPTGQLPRDPATILVALSGQATILADILDPEVADEMVDGPPPAELNALTVDALEVTAAGASLTGTGDFTFDNSDTTTFDGMPRPTGAVDLTLVGGNGLLDKLVAMGLVPESEASGARMMMGLFAVPGDGEDTLNSKIEINEEGHILANGQRIQ